MLVIGERTELNGPFFHGAFDTFKMPLPPPDFSSNFGAGGAGLFNRDNGATFWGRIDPPVGHLQYSVAVMSGLRSAGAFGPNQTGSLLYAGRLTYNFLNPELNPGYYTSGTYFGEAGDILAIAVGGQYQQSGAGSFEHRSNFALLTADLLFEKHLAPTMTRACSRTTLSGNDTGQITTTLHLQPRRGLLLYISWARIYHLRNVSVPAGGVDREVSALWEIYVYSC